MNQNIQCCIFLFHATVVGAAKLVDEAIACHFRGDLEYRRDIGTPEYVARMKAEIS